MAYRRSRGYGARRYSRAPTRRAPTRRSRGVRGGFRSGRTGQARGGRYRSTARRYYYGGRYF